MMTRSTIGSRGLSGSRMRFRPKHQNPIPPHIFIALRETPRLAVFADRSGSREKAHPAYRGDLTVRKLLCRVDGVELSDLEIASLLMLPHRPSKGLGNPCERFKSRPSRPILLSWERAVP